MINPKKIFYCCLFLLIGSVTHAQHSDQLNISISGVEQFTNDSSAKFCIKEIIIKGNKKTKGNLILKETPFKKGDSLKVSDFAASLLLARQLVYNTSLFAEVKIDLLVVSAKEILIVINVKERWYIYPIPQFQLVDRNFNDWYKTFHHSLERVNYGIKFTNYSLTGKRDQLKLYLINGYSRNISFVYSRPYTNEGLNRGFAIAGGYTQNREVAYNTASNNTVLFYPVDSLIKSTNSFVRNSWYLSTSYVIRNGLFTRQFFSAAFVDLKVTDSVIIKNHNYFKDSVNAKSYLDMAYTYQYSNVNNVSYPLKGLSVYVTVLKRGLGFTQGLDMFSVEAGLSKYFDLRKNWYASFQFTGKIKLPFNQSYFNQRGLGYGETYLRGLEYTVIDGVAYSLLKSTLKKKLFSFNVPFPFIPKIITKIPFTFYAKTYTDLGYSYNIKTYDTFLNNRFLYTGGFGIDILTLYDINLRFEYSFNQLNKSGLFFHAQNGF